MPLNVDDIDWSDPIAANRLLRMKLAELEATQGGKGSANNNNRQQQEYYDDDDDDYYDNDGEYYEEQRYAPPPNAHWENFEIFRDGTIIRIFCK